MTNKEKAEEITNAHLNEWIAEFVENNNLSKDDRNQIRFKLYNACEEMAAWKDGQFAKEKSALINRLFQEFEFENFTYSDGYGGLDFDYDKFCKFLDKVFKL